MHANENSRLQLPTMFDNDSRLIEGWAATDTAAVLSGDLA